MKFAQFLALCLAFVPAAWAQDMPYCNDERFTRTPRCFAVLDNGGERGERITIITVDNASRMTNAQVADLVMTADRSTQDGSPNKAPFRKGLMADGDRVCVTDAYVAWFDYSVGDGTFYDPKVYGTVQTKFRAGALTGLWTLDPATGAFRHQRPSPDGSGDRWAHNELIPGSASPDGQHFWWDAFGPPIEHTFAIPTTVDPEWAFFLFTYEYATPGGPGGWRVTADGERSADGVRYATASLMTSWKGKVDVVDGEDAVDIKNSVEAIVEYICRPDEIVTVWRFRPTKADIVINNIYVILWLGYTPGIDGTRCDTNPLGNQWPGSVYGTARYGRSSETMRDNVRFAPRAPGAVAEMPIQEPPCNRRNDGTYPDYHNNVLGTFPDYRVRAGTWMELGETLGLPPGSPGLRMTVLDDPSTGAGTSDDPERIAWNDIGAAHENVDGTIVFGTGSVNRVGILRAGRWYQSAVAIAPLR